MIDAEVRSRRRPLVGLVLLFVAGILLGLHIACPSDVWFLAVGLGCAITAFFLRRAGPALLHVALFLSGWVAADLEIRNPSPACLARQFARDREYASMIGVVTDEPAPLNPGNGRNAWSVPLRVEGLHRARDWRRVRGDVDALCEGRGAAPPAHYGDRMLLSGTFAMPSDPGRIGPISRIRLYVDATSVRRLGEGHGHALVAWCLRGRERCAEILSRGVAGYGDETGFLLAMMLGLREDLSASLFRAFAQTGTLHVVAISGTHIAVAALIFVAVVRATGLSRRYWILVLAPLLALYTLATGMSASAVRACVMALAFWSAPLFLRRADGWSALALSAAVILAVQPSQLLEAGFILSFGIVAGLMLFYAPIARPLDALWNPDPWRLQPEAWPVRAVRKTGRLVTALVAASIAAWLVSTPMTAALFHNVSPVSLAANLFVIPLSSAMLLTGFLSLSTGWFSPFLAEVFNHANRVFAWLLLRIVEAFNACPHGSFFVVSPSWLWIAIWYAAVAAVLLGHGLLRRVGIAVSVASLVVALALYASDHAARVDVLGTGRVAVALCDVPGGGDVLVNAGDAGAARRVVKWLRTLGVDRLRALVLTAATADVAGAAPEILDQVPVDELWIGPLPARSKIFQAALDAARAKGLVVRTLACGDRGCLAGGVEWEVLHPARSDARAAAADGSLVLRFARAASSVLMASPSSAAEQEAIAARPVELAAGALIVDEPPGPSLARAAGGAAVLIPGSFEETVVRFDDLRGVEIVRVDD